MESIKERFVTNTPNFCSSNAKYGSFGVNERSPLKVKGPRALFKPNKGFMQDFSLGEWGEGCVEACQGHMSASVHPLKNSGHI